MNLLDITFAVIPDGIIGVVFITFVASNDVGCVPLDPLVPLVVFEVERSCDMGLDEECANTGIQSIKMAASSEFETYGSKTMATVPAIKAAMIGMMILGWLMIQSLM